MSLFISGRSMPENMDSPSKHPMFLSALMAVGGWLSRIEARRYGYFTFNDLSIGSLGRQGES